jgi:hypothetical protein
LRWGRGKDVVKAKYSVTMPLRIEVENLIFCERRKGEKRGKREKTLSGLTKYMGGVVVALSKLVSPPTVRAVTVPSLKLQLTATAVKQKTKNPRPLLPNL